MFQASLDFFSLRKGGIDLHLQGFALLRKLNGSCLARLVFASIYYDLAKLSTRTRSVYRVIHSRLYLESA